jgi:DNA-binding transcriptional ArsR family regulator
MSAPDDIIHQAIRLKIMAALNAVAKSDQLEFGRLKAITGATDGNLGAHLGTLADAGYVKITKDYVGKKPRTRAAMTVLGRRAFESHVAFLRDILDQPSAGTVTPPSETPEHT